MCQIIHYSISKSSKVRFRSSCLNLIMTSLLRLHGNTNGHRGVRLCEHSYLQYVQFDPRIGVLRHAYSEGRVVRTRMTLIFTFGIFLGFLLFFVVTMVALSTVIEYLQTFLTKRILERHSAKTKNCIKRKIDRSSTFCPKIFLRKTVKKNKTQYVQDNQIYQHKTGSFFGKNIFHPDSSLGQKYLLHTSKSKISHKNLGFFHKNAAVFTTKTKNCLSHKKAAFGDVTKLMTSYHSPVSESQNNS